MIGAQAASERSEQTTCRGYYILLYCFAAILFVITLHIRYVRIFEYLDGTTFRLGGPSFELGWAYFQERGFSKICPPPSLSCHLSSLPMGIFSRAYSTSTWFTFPGQLMLPPR